MIRIVKLIEVDIGTVVINKEVMVIIMGEKKYTLCTRVLKKILIYFFIT
jgi:hypothetical protein